MTDRNLDVVHRYFDCINNRDWDGVAAVTVDTLSTVVRDYLWRAHPDLHIGIEWMQAHGDKVSVWCYGSGTHQAAWELPPSMGDFAGRTLPPTGKQWRTACATTYRLDAERIVEVWAVWDWLGLLCQLGAVNLTVT